MRTIGFLLLLLSAIRAAAATYDVRALLDPQETVPKAAAFTFILNAIPYGEVRRVECTTEQCPLTLIGGRWEVWAPATGLRVVLDPDKEEQGE